MPPIRPRFVVTFLAIILTIAAWTAASPGFALFGKGVTAEDFEKETPGPGLLATVSEDEAANDACPGQAIECGDLVVRARIDEPGDLDNYAVAVAEGTCLTVGTTVDSLQESTDTVIEILNEDCSVVMIMDDDNGPGSFSLISEFRVPAAGTYVIRVRHYLSGGTGTYRLFVKCAAAGAPNATCQTATLVTCGNIDLSGTTDCTGNEYDPRGPLTSCTQFSAAGQDVVYQVNAIQGNTINLTYQSSADASIYLVTDCSSPADFCVAGADSRRAGEAETLTYVFPDSATYYIILDSFGNMTSGAWTLKGEFDCVTPVESVTWGQIKSRYAYGAGAH